MKHMLTARGALSLALLAGSAMNVSTSAAAEAAQRPAQIKVMTPAGETWLATRLNQFVRFGSKPTGMFGVFIHDQGGGAYRVDLFRALASGDPGPLSPAGYMLVDTFTLAGNASAARRLTTDLSVDVAIPVGAMKEIEIGEDDTAGCCVYCDNGVEICGTKVRSSCGNCG